MADAFPTFLSQGEQARLFPVLATTSKEGRTTSIVLACLAKIDELGAALLSSVGKKVGVRSKIETYTEIVCKNGTSEIKDRPDGLVILRNGSNEWRALVETKIGNNELETSQIERYRQLAKDNRIDCVITISNQFATRPTVHPLADVNKSRSKVPVFHWSWMYILTEADLLISQDTVADVDQRTLLNELRRFLSHESAGVKGFDRMPKEWSDLNKLVSSGGAIPAKSEDAVAVLAAWHQETRDLALILSRLTEASVSERLSKKHRTDATLRIKDELTTLRDKKQISVFLEIPDAAAPLEVFADLPRRTVDVGMSLRAPEDRVSTKARVNWLLRQIKSDRDSDLHIRLMWPGKNEPTQHSVEALRENVEIASEGKAHLAPHSFHVFHSKRLGARFTQQVNFITDLEECVPAFYRDVGSDLSAWKKPAPKIKHDRNSANDVTTEAIEEDAEAYRPT
ncbi:hypothetical protein [uncultured Tateyamaria sp.]|uniref:hypothetical protein n=1 Tax=uncultured Tateyamaria sp. TaxID=455651 RepID=UPI00260A974E|nr:hypothetical protein [uncultured Tateyamaria sp.]